MIIYRYISIDIMSCSGCPLSFSLETAFDGLFAQQFLQRLHGRCKGPALVFRSSLSSPVWKA